MTSSSSRWLFGVALCAASCVVSARNSGHDTRITEGGRATAPIKPPAVPSDEATAGQLQLAREEGQAADAAVAWWTGHGVFAAGRMGAGEYEVTFALRPLSGAWVPGGPTLAWRPETGSALLALVVQDGADRRPVPGLNVTARVSGGHGATVETVHLAYRWGLPVEMYAAPTTLPPGPLTIRFDIDPPAYWRHDPVNGDRFANPVFAEFTDVPFAPTAWPTASKDGDAALALASAQGAALGWAFDEMSRAVANTGAQTTVGDVRVAYAVEYAETYWQMCGHRLEYNGRPEQSAETNAHVEIAVMDALTGRLLPDLNVRVAVSDESGHPISVEVVPFMWHPWIHHYGRNWRVPRAGHYRLQVHVDPPPWARTDRDLGRRFEQAIDVQFDDVPFHTGQK
jgi:hypothetical protein